MPGPTRSAEFLANAFYSGRFARSLEAGHAGSGTERLVARGLLPLSLVALAAFIGLMISRWDDLWVTITAWI